MVAPDWDDESFRAALRVRREVLGDEYVDRALHDDSVAARDTQHFITTVAWGRWTNTDLSRRDRSLVTLSIAAATGRMEEFTIHLRGAERNGVSDESIDELVRHIGAYAGIPATLAARRAVVAYRGQRSTEA